MFIDTFSHDRIENSLADFLSISLDNLRQYTKYFSTLVSLKNKSFDANQYYSEFSRLVAIDNIELINEILFFHLSRRLNGSENNTIGRNLEDLLIHDSEIKCFLKRYHIDFEIKEQHIATYYYDKEVDWDNCENGNSCYMKSRLGYYKGRQDFCINGFGLKEYLCKNQYYSILKDAPEFISQIGECLNIDGIVEDYRDNSSFYCYVYRIPIELIIFDGYDDYTIADKQEHIVKCALFRLQQVINNESDFIIEYDNPVIRLKDNYTIPDKYCVTKEQILL